MEYKMIVILVRQMGKTRLYGFKIKYHLKYINNKKRNDVIVKANDIIIKWWQNVIL